MSQPFTTRAEAAAPPRHLVRLMVVAAYEAGRPKGSGRPEFENTTQEWQDAMFRDMTAAILAAEAAGYRIELRAAQSQPSADAGTHIPRSPQSPCNLERNG